MSETMMADLTTCAKCGQGREHPHHDSSRWPGRLTTGHAYHPFLPYDRVTLDDVLPPLLVYSDALSSNRAIKLDKTEDEVARLQGELTAMTTARDLWKRAYDDLLVRHSAATIAAPSEGQ